MLSLFTDAVYRQHVAHRRHDNDNKQQDVRRWRPEPGLHPDHPGTAEDRTDGERAEFSGNSHRHTGTC